MSLETQVGRVLHDSNDVIKNRITANLVNTIRDNQIRLEPGQVDEIIAASHAALDSIGLNVASTIARICDKVIQEEAQKKTTRSKRKK